MTMLGHYPINAMRFSLRTLLIVMLVVPPLIGAGWALRHIAWSFIDSELPWFVALVIIALLWIMWMDRRVGRKE